MVRALRLSVALIGLCAAGAAGASDGMVFTPSQQGHWAWKRPVRPRIPAVKARQWIANPIDAFILAKLDTAGLKPAPIATREQLIRRLAFDLTGLPPTPAEVEAFLADRTPTAWEKVVDHYLASPAFGERWGRHWMDLARYADSNGYEFDEARPDAWRYRDYVVRSLNADKPYNRFIEEQLAGDEIAPNDPDALIATGFNLLGPDMTDAADQAARRQNTLNDMTDTAGLVFLGLTLGCARCHDHKYEPLPQKDYYRFQAFFAGSRFRTDLTVATPEQREEFQREQSAFEETLKRARAELAEVAGPLRERLRRQKIATLSEDLQTAFNAPEGKRTTEQAILVERNAKLVEPTTAQVRELLAAELRPKYDQFSRALAAIEARKPAPLPRAIGLRDEGTEAPKTFLLERGELANRGDEVAPGYPIILSSAGVTPKLATATSSTGRRTALAHWIASAENPLTSRVMVNRVWQHLLGRGLVPSPSDFGVRGESPTHPELVDWLATAFSGVSNSKIRVPGTISPKHNPEPGTRNPALNWSVKGLIRLIATSNTYKQSSVGTAAALRKDPENELFSRMNRKRLEGEAIRDTVLAISGKLNPKFGGPGVFPPIPPEALPPKANAWPVSKNPADHARRSLYTFARRNLQYPALEVFDAPDSNASCARREVTTSAPQALSLLNAPEMGEHARAMALRIVREVKPNTERIALAYRLALGRGPTPEESMLGREFLIKQESLLTSPRTPIADDAPAVRALADYCLALMNLNEFVYVD